MTCREVAVVVPARDEEAALPDCLRALQVAAANCPVATRIVLVDDASRDDTARIGRALLPSPHQVVAGPGSDVGSARRWGAEVAASVVTDPVRTWLASTDADSVVPPDWLQRHLAHADRGVDALAGVVRLGEQAEPGLATAFRAHYGGASSGPHPHLHAANLGIRLTTLQAAGSWRAATHAEEHDLWQRLPVDACVVADAAVVVTTSHRRHGRAPWGFAADLDRLLRERGVPDPVRRPEVGIAATGQAAVANQSRRW